jgi:hypothetical protein
MARRLVHGQSEGRREATGASGVLSRSGTSSCVSWRAWASLGTVWARLSWSMPTSKRSRGYTVVISRVRASSETC